MGWHIRIRSTRIDDWKFFEQVAGSEVVLLKM